MGIPYLEIGLGIGLFLGIWAFIMAEERGKLFIASVMAGLFVLPILFPTPAVSFLRYLGWIALGIGSYIYLRYQGVGIR